MEQTGDVEVVALAERRVFRYIVSLLHRVSQCAVELTVDTPVLDLQFLCRNQLAALPEMSDDFIHQENNRYAEAFRHIEGANNFVIAFLHRRWGNHDDRMVAVRAPFGLHQISL